MFAFRMLGLFNFSVYDIFLSCTIRVQNRSTYVFSVHSRDCIITPSPHDRLQALHELHLPQLFFIVTLFDLYFMCSDINRWISKLFELFSVEVFLVSFLELIEISVCELLFVSTSTLLLLLICSFDKPSIWFLITSNVVDVVVSCFSLFLLMIFLLSSVNECSTTLLLLFGSPGMETLFTEKSNSSLLLIVS